MIKDVTAALECLRLRRGISSRGSDVLPISRRSGFTQIPTFDSIPGHRERLYAHGLNHQSPQGHRPEFPMQISTSDFKKGIKVLIDNEPHEMIECEFKKPGKGQALYRTKLRNLVKGSLLDRTYKNGDRKSVV